MVDIIKPDPPKGTSTAELRECVVVVRRSKRYGWEGGLERTDGQLVHLFNAYSCTGPLTIWRPMKWWACRAARRWQRLDIRSDDREKGWKRC